VATRRWATQDALQVLLLLPHQPRDGSWGEPCTHRRYYHAARLHTLLRDVLTALPLDHAALAATLQVAPAKPLDLSPALAGIERKLERASEAYIGGVWTLTEYAAEKTRLEAQRDALLVQAEPSPAVPHDLSGLAAQVTVALASDDLAETVRLLGVRGVMQPDGRLEVTLDPL